MVQQALVLIVLAVLESLDGSGAEDQFRPGGHPVNAEIALDPTFLDQTRDVNFTLGAHLGMAGVFRKRNVSFAYAGGRRIPCC